LQAGNQICSSHDDKEAFPFHHFSTHFGQPTPPGQSLRWDSLGLPNCDLRHLEDEFTEEEVRVDGW
jgi:hypothetical protein